MTRLVYLLESLFPGGAQHALLRLISSLDRDRWAPEVWLLRQGGELLPRFVAEKIPIRDRTLWDWNPNTRVVKATAFKCAAGLALSGASIVHSFSWEGVGTEAIGVTLAGVGGYIVRIATANPVGNEKGWELKLRLADCIVVLSEFSRHCLTSRFPWIASKIRCIPNGVDCADFRPCSDRRAELRAALQIPGDAYVIGCIARLCDDKNHALLLRAFARLPSLGQRQAHVLLAGIGPNEHKLRALCSELQVNDRVHFLGYRQDIATVLAAADVGVLPSRTPEDGGVEGMSNAVLEAMSTGVPVVITRNGSEEVVKSGEDGFIVDPLDPADMAAALQILFEQRGLTVELGQAARRKILASYSLARCTAANMKLYEETLTQSQWLRRVSRLWNRGRVTTLFKQPQSDFASR